MKLWKILTPVVVCLVLALLILPGRADAAFSGDCGENLTWTLDDEGTLTISGTGPMKDYTFFLQTPWRYSNVKNVVISEGVTSVGDYAFYCCTNIKTVTIPEGVTTIGECALYGTAITTVTLPDSVISMDNYALGWCANLTEVKLGNNLAVIGAYAFDQSDKLESISLPDSITAVGAYSFYNNESMTYNIFDNARYLGNENNPYLVLIDTVGAEEAPSEIHPDTRVIADEAFRQRGPKTITIPKNVVTIGEWAFYPCGSLEGIWVDAENMNYSNDDHGALYNKNKTVLIRVPSKMVGSYTIPHGVTTIEDHAFNDCRMLTDVTIPGSLTSIGVYAFYNCSQLTDVYYNGTQTMWDAITIEKNNDPLLNATLHVLHWLPGDVDGDEKATADDAVYLLLHVMFGNRYFPVDADLELDFDGSGAVDTDDALYLLLHVMFGEEDYPLSA